MPHVTLKMMAGRPEEKKQELAQKLAQVVKDVIGSADASVSVAIFDIESDKWTSDVYDPEIVPNEDKLYKRPGYGSLASK